MKEKKNKRTFMCTNCFKSYPIEMGRWSPLNGATVCENCLSWILSNKGNPNEWNYDKNVK